ncbi:MAG: carboxypeptidase regulatory-like domain-containing protein, partial [Acidobacteria bacterium]|nr:carboxypeptidase regulatory-like domain-containing protein [Acidobacteriota bacterium]
MTFSSLWLFAFALPGAWLCAGAQSSPPAHDSRMLVVLVADENGVAVPAARVTIEGPGGTKRCQSDRAGRCTFPELVGASWALRVEKESFYVFILSPVQTSGTLEVALTHQQEVRETVDVHESSPAIDPAQV